MTDDRILQIMDNYGVCSHTETLIMVQEVVREVEAEQSHQTSEAVVPLNVGLAGKDMQSLLVEAFRNGYEAGHDDTVESCYTDAEERGKDWLPDAISDGVFEAC